MVIEDLDGIFTYPYSSTNEMLEVAEKLGLSEFQFNHIRESIEMMGNVPALMLKSSRIPPESSLVQRKVGITIAEASKKYNISKSTLYRRARTNELPGCRRIGHKFVIHDPTFETWLQSGGQVK